MMIIMMKDDNEDDDNDYENNLWRYYNKSKIKVKVVIMR